MAKTIFQGSSGGFVDDTEDLEASNLTGILSGLSLSVIKVSGNGDDCVARIVVNIKRQILWNQTYLTFLLRYCLAVFRILVTVAFDC